MSGSGCYTRTGLCAVRFSRLNADGTPAGGNTAGAVARVAGMSSIKWTGQYISTPDIAELDGCGALAVVKPPEQLLKRFDVEVDLLVESFELHEIATGAQLLVQSAAVVGYADLIDVACGGGATLKPGVCVEAWSINWDCGEQNPTYPYLRDVFTKVKFAPSDGQSQLGANHLILKGPTFVNNQIGNGPFNDFPSAFTALTQTGKGVFRDTALPAAEAACGYVVTPSQS